MVDRELGNMVKFIKPPGGMAIWATVNQKPPLAELSSKLANEGIYMNDGSRYDCTEIAPNSLTIGFASMNEKEMSTFIQALKSLK